MKLITIFSFMLIAAFATQAQEVDNLDTLTVPEDAKQPAQKKAEAAVSELSLPGGSTATSSIGKSRANDLKKSKDNVGAILDFEGEVIEGERRRPDLFLQISIDNIKFDSLIYNRDDFNDYLEVDRKSRTRFLKMK